MKQLMQRLRNIIFPLDFIGFLRFSGSKLGGKIDLGVSWRPLGCVLGPLGGFSGHLNGDLGSLGRVLEEPDAIRTRAVAVS